MGKGEKGKGKGKGYGKAGTGETRPYRGSRAGKNVQEKRGRAYWRSQGWELVEGEWWRVEDLPQDEE